MPVEHVHSNSHREGSCSELGHLAKKFHALGGEDIECWGEGEFRIEGSQKSIDWAKKQLEAE